MNPWVPYGLLLFLGAAWTAIWLWVMAHAGGPPVAYETVARRGEPLRRRLFATAGIILVLALLASLRWLPYRAFAVARLGTPSVRVAVTARQWQWTLTPPQVPADTPVEFAVTSVDVNHGFGIYTPSGHLMAQVQAMPGFTNHLVVEFPRPGQYLVRCLEYCGIPHIGMLGVIEVK